MTETQDRDDKLTLVDRAEAPSAQSLTPYYILELRMIKLGERHEGVEEIGTRVVGGRDVRE